MRKTASAFIIAANKYVYGTEIDAAEKSELLSIPHYGFVFHCIKSRQKSYVPL